MCTRRIVINWTALLPLKYLKSNTTVTRILSENSEESLLQRQVFLTQTL